MLDPGTFAFLWFALGLAAIIATILIVALMERLESGSGPGPRAACDTRVLRGAPPA